MDGEPEPGTLRQHKARRRDHKTRGAVGRLEHRADLPMVCIEEVVHKVGADRPHPDEQRQTYGARDTPQTPATRELGWSANPRSPLHGERGPRDA
jgi:hypothetical protein